MQNTTHFYKKRLTFYTENTVMLQLERSKLNQACQSLIMLKYLSLTFIFAFKFEVNQMFLYAGSLRLLFF